MAFVDHYKILQVDVEADPDVIQAAYRTLARKYHPDIAGTREALDKMRAINAAWQMLRDPERRQAYDKLRAEKLDGHAPSRARPAASSATAAAPPATPKPAWPEGRPGFKRYDAKPRGARATPGNTPDPATQQGTVLDFGRYKGWSLREIAKEDPAFLEWFVRMPIARPYVREINELLGEIGRRNAAEAKPVAQPAKRGLFRR